MKYLIVILISLFSFSESKKIDKVFEFNIKSTINPATYRYLEKGFKKIESTDLALIKLNTPGGLVSTTKDILNLFGESNFPVIVWVAPEGSSATSAGALISAGADYLFMSEGTNIGAATPITSTGQNIPGQKKDEKSPIENSDMRAKAINDLVALTKSLCEKHKRNEKAFSLMISEAKSFSAEEAKKENVINEIINSKKELVEEFEKNGKLDLSNSEFIEVKRSIVDSILDTIAHPQLAYMFFLIGAALLYFELQAPGGFIAGVIGLGCLIIAGIGFQVLPINFAAVGLIVLSLVLFILESYIVSYGILFIGGILALLFGSFLLFDTPDSLLVLDKKVIYATVAALVGIFGLIAYMFFRESKDEVKTNFEIPEGKSGSVFKVLDLIGSPLYQIKVQGQFWKARSDENLEPGDTILVEGRFSQEKEPLVLKIKKS